MDQSVNQSIKKVVSNNDYGIGYSGRGNRTYNLCHKISIKESFLALADGNPMLIEDFISFDWIWLHLAFKKIFFYCTYDGRPISMTMKTKHADCVLGYQFDNIFYTNSEYLSWRNIKSCNDSILMYWPLGTILSFDFSEPLRGNSFSRTFENYRENVAVSQDVSSSSFVQKDSDDVISKISSSLSIGWFDSVGRREVGSGSEASETSARNQNTRFTSLVAHEFKPHNQHGWMFAKNCWNRVAIKTCNSCFFKGDLQPSQKKLSSFLLAYSLITEEQLS